MTSEPKRRILWLINHATLMAFEVPLMRSLGFEVYTPKLLPKRIESFRSAGVDFTHDESLSIPRADLAALNSFNFWDGAWPKQIRRIVNEHFDCCFTIVWKPTTMQVMENFEGPVVLRAFGLPEPLSYGELMSSEFGFDETAAKMWRLWREDRFRFGQGYPFLVEAEHFLTINKSAVYLPIGLPRSAERLRGSWTGGERRILFFCGNINDSGLYRSYYDAFKATFGDLPHSIVGIQNAHVDDPNVLGFVPQEQLNHLLRTSSLVYDDTTQPRHLHYHAIEAVNVGAPLLFRAGSLLSRMAPSVTTGRAGTDAEARATAEQLLTMGANQALAFNAQQEPLLNPFLAPHCERHWREILAPLVETWRKPDKPRLRPVARLLSLLETLTPQRRSVLQQRTE